MMPTSEQIEKAREAVQELANVNMTMSLVDWIRISNAILEALSAAEGVKPIDTAPKDGRRILLHPAVEVHDDWSKGRWSDNFGWIVDGSPSGVEHTHWADFPARPRLSALQEGE